MVLAWIRLPNLPGHLYKRKIIEAIESLIGKVVKLDVQTDNQTRGRFARLAVYINLIEPLISQVLVDGVVQQVEYESFPTVCFSCGKYGHVKDLCPLSETEQNRPVPLGEPATVEIFGWRRFRGANRKEGGAQINLKSRVNQENGEFLSNKAGHVGGIVGLTNGSDRGMEVGRVSLQETGQKYNKSLDKALGKRPIILDGHLGNIGDQSDKSPFSFSNSIPVAPNPNFSKTNNSSNGADGQGLLVPNNLSSLDIENMEKIKARYNPVFDESEGIIVPISDNTLDPGGSSQSNRKPSFTLWGRGSRFKNSGNTRISLAESMKKMAEFLSSKIPSCNPSDVSEIAESELEGKERS
ncbi:hypothetical protein GOBAR_AA11682 [Gossypium barbadense]|uniref:CCHC-type domain-containing protein n=1 Tax=Gossypium barbadense TaxID=3634 RepID=A0A2P5Y042_GOSBA|nr:hypothetical protein GOBAR_AA11682 [Gossypium barbadense]